MRNVLETANLFDYFNEEVESARAGRGSRISDDTGLYLATLLADRVRADRPAPPEDTLAELHARAATSPLADQAKTYRELGDRSLYRVGYFAESLDTFVKDLQRASPTLFVSVPRLWLKFQQGVFTKMPKKKLARLLKVPILSRIVRKKVLRGLGLEHVRFAGSGSAPIPPELIQWYLDLGLELLEGYGMSENFNYSHVSRPGQARVGYVGHTYPEVEHRLSEEGEILVKSPGSMLGYYKEPELTKQAFTEDGFLKTGDRGEIDDQGRLRITGRIKELFKTSKGKYVAPAPIENKLLSHELVELACVSGSGFPQPHAVLQLGETVAGKSRDELTASLQAHLKAVNAQLDHHEQLSFLAVASESWQIENGFLTPSMKLKRPKIEDTYAPLAEAWYEAKTPVVWQE